MQDMLVAEILYIYYIYKDYEILKHFCNKFNTEKGINPIKNVKARLRMLDAIEKLRKVLSANNEA